MHLKLVERYETLIRNRRRRVPHYPQPLAFMIPNLLTVGAMCSGMTAIRFALIHQIEYAVIAVLLAVILDGLDGRIARLLKCTSQFGAQLDSLADVVSFGVAPAVIMYVLRLETLGNPGWGAVLFFAACGALRLARFNVAAIEGKGGDQRRPWSVGLPIPAGALWALSPFMFQLGLEQLGWQAAWINEPKLMLVNAVIAGFLMVSRIPTVLINKIKIKPKYGILVLALAVCLFAFVYSVPWVTVSALAILYVLMMPVTLLKARRYLRAGAPDAQRQ